MWGQASGALRGMDSTSRPYFSESRAMRALSRVSFPGPGFASPAGPAGSRLSGAGGAMLCGLSSSESRGPTVLQGEEEREMLSSSA